MHVNYSESASKDTDTMMKIIEPIRKSALLLIYTGGTIGMKQDADDMTLIDYLRLSLTLARVWRGNRNGRYNRHEYGCSVKNRCFIPISNSRKRLVCRSCANAAAQSLLKCGQERSLVCHRSSG